MRSNPVAVRSVACAVAATLAWFAAVSPASTQTSIDDLVSGIVRIRTYINPDGRTVPNLGRQRQGSGIVIDSNGLVLTIGYLMVEAHKAEISVNEGDPIPADVLGYHHDTGFGLLRSQKPLNVRPLPIGKSAELKERDPVLAASFGGRAGIAPAYVVARREFAGAWEYLIDDAIFTAPAHNEWSGAALINREGKLVGVGSLIVGDTSGKGDGVAGNMYVPIDLLTPILADLMAGGAANSPSRPWLGLTTEEIRGRLFVSRVAPEGPAEKAGLKRGDIVVGVRGEPAKSLADFYRKVWAVGPAGAVVPLDVLQENGVRQVEVRSMNRNAYLKLKTTF